MRIHFWSETMWPSQKVRTSAYVASTFALAANLVTAGVLTNLTATALQESLSAGGYLQIAADGQLNLTESLLVRTNVTIDASGRLVTLDGGDLTRHFVVTNAASLILINLKLAHGRATGLAASSNQVATSGYGGSIYVSGGTLEVENCRFVANQAIGGDQSFKTAGTGAGAAFGGAIYCDSGKLQMTDCTFSANWCRGGHTSQTPDYWPPDGSGYGGAVFGTNSMLSFSRVTFTSNAVVNVPGLNATGGNGFGGAIADRMGELLIEDSVFVSNRAVGGTGDAWGGAIYHVNGDGVVRRTLFSMDSAVGGDPLHEELPWWGTAGVGSGGALYVQDGNFLLDSSAIISCQAVGGTARVMSQFDGGPARGGGISFYSDSGHFNLVNCTLAGNSAFGGDGANGGRGSGGALEGGSFDLLNVTIAENAVRDGTSGFPHRSPLAALPGTASIFGSANLTNTILWCAAGQTNVSGRLPLVDGGHNISSDSSANFTMPTSQNMLDPLLGPLANNGGSTPTMALLPSSPAMDAGDDSMAPGTDQRGIRRPQGRHCDIGAFELEPQLSLSRTPNGTVTVSYIFQAGKTNRIDFSTNLFQWSELCRGITDPDGRLTCDDFGGVAFQFKFYRTLPQPP